MKPYFFLAFLTAALLSGCANPDSGTTLNDFQDRLQNDAGSEAVACGTLAILDSRLDANICLTQAFSNATSAYALFLEQGIDSQVAQGTVTQNGNVTFYSFDSDPTGGGATDNGKITSSPCEQPQLSGTVDDQTIFNCDNDGNPVLSPLLGTVWLWSGYRTASGIIVNISPEPAYSLKFSDQTSFTGFESCNAYAGMWNIDESPFVVPESTAVDTGFCDSALEDAPSFLQTLEAASLLTISEGPSGDRLFVDTVDGQGISLTFTEGIDLRIDSN